ncbi:MAG: type VI secretion system lipoprotein TssJ, partial [Casimicrobiaceae bacterium]
RSTAGFESADFFSLYERDQATLTSEALARDQFIMKPGETQSFTRKANSDARYLGVLAAYRDLEHSAWRATAAIAPPAQVPRSAGSTGRQQRMRITVNRAAVNIEVAVAS